MQRFWAQGYLGTSLQDLLDAMHLSKSSLYQAFGGKEALFCRCLERYTRQMAGGMRNLLAKAPNGLAFVGAFLRTAVEEAKSRSGARGCLVINTATEFAQREPRIAAAVSQALDEIRQVLVEAVVRGQADGSIRTGRDPAVLAGFLVMGMSGLKAQAKAGVDGAALEAVVQVVLSSLA